MFAEPYKKALGEIHARFNEAEKFIKAAEKINKLVATAAINEIRYAFRRSSDLYALLEHGTKTSDLETPEGILFEIEQLCVRAKHDALDASLTFFSEFFEDVSKKSKLTTICAICPNFLEVLRLQGEIDAEIALSREERNKRQEIYKEVFEKHFPVLFDAFQNLRHSEEIINAEFLSIKRKEIKDNSVVILSTILAVLGILVGVLALPWVAKYFGV